MNYLLGGSHSFQNINLQTDQPFEKNASSFKNMKFYIKQLLVISDSRGINSDVTI